MGLRRWILGMLDRGGDPPAADEPVVLVVVSIAQAPMIVEGLVARGIDATWLPSYDLVTESTTQGTIKVPRSQLAEGTSRLSELM